jgi:hypothetical protein
MMAICDECVEYLYEQDFIIDLKDIKKQIRDEGF